MAYLTPVANCAGGQGGGGALLHWGVPGPGGSGLEEEVEDVVGGVVPGRRTEGQRVLGRGGRDHGGAVGKWGGHLSLSSESPTS